MILPGTGIKSSSKTLSLNRCSLISIFILSHLTRRYASLTCFKYQIQIICGAKSLINTQVATTSTTSKTFCVRWKKSPLRHLSSVASLQLFIKQISIVFYLFGTSGAYPPFTPCADTVPFRQHKIEECCDTHDLYVWAVAERNVRHSVVAQVML